jgi:hypothetical protein
VALRGKLAYCGIVLTALGGISSPPRMQIDGADDHAEHVGGNESHLGSSEADDTNDNTINAGYNPTLPAPPPNQNR